MPKQKISACLKNFLEIQSAAIQSDDGNRCLIAPHPKLKKKLRRQIQKLREASSGSIFASHLNITEPDRPGFNDGLIYPGDTFPLGTALSTARSSRLKKSPLRGVTRVAVILVDFDDKPMKKTPKHFKDLFFSKGVIPTGSVREYYEEVTNGKVDIQGEVVGPYRLPKTLKEYANRKSGTGDNFPNSRTMAKDAAIAADVDIDFSKYDNDKDGYVDAFVVIHAGTGAEESDNPHHIWSHKWVLQGREPYVADRNMKIYSYLTVPEDCKVGVCAHELGHLLFGFPDLYDADYSSEGVGDWCLMGSGSWNNNGLTPAHPSSWCKCQQGWVTTKAPKANKKDVSIGDVKESNIVYRLWENGKDTREYFLIENRQKTGYDKYLPSSGLLIWHVNENFTTNEKEGRYRVALIQADGKKHLEKGKNSGDAGDCFPGTSSNNDFDKNTKPGSLSYGGKDSKVAINNIRKKGKGIVVDIKVK
jgi:immune inhibitor A